MSSASEPVQRGPAERLLTVLHYATPLLVLACYLIAFTTRSIVASKREPQTAEDVVEQYGPGGKPLPKKLNRNRVKNKKGSIDLDFSRPRKLLFVWLSILVAGTYLANAVNVIVHALIKRDEGWWCGKSATVSYLLVHPKTPLTHS